jgi:hypothetical protein
MMKKTTIKEGSKKEKKKREFQLIKRKKCKIEEN